MTKATAVLMVGVLALVVFWPVEGGVPSVPVSAFDLMPVVTSTAVVGPATLTERVHLPALMKNVGCQALPGVFQCK